MAMPAAFDPLIDFDGMWTTKLAKRYLPLPELPTAKYECIDGRLIVRPTEVGANSYGEGELISLMKPSAKAAGLYVYGSVNLAYNPDTWIQPDVTVLHTLPRTDEEDMWIPVGFCSMVVEFVSKSSRKQDFVNKPQRCAQWGIPYFMRVELVRQLGHASVDLLKLLDGEYKQLATGISGQRFEASEPFPMGFDPRQLLP
jgi:Uma2 family endonuclease